MNPRALPPLLLCVLLAGATLVPSPSFAAEPVPPPALAPLPPPPSPSENPTTPEKVELGKKLFFDRRLSGDGTMSCATCHDPETGFADALPTSLSYPTTRNWRNSPGLVNVAYRKRLFHDGRATSLEEQALFPMMSPFEMNRNLDYLEEVLKTVPAYVEAFRSVFGGEITRQRVAMAIAAFERTLLSRDTPLDRHLRGEPGALSARQRAGLALFLGKAGCATCHNGPNLTDEYWLHGGTLTDIYGTVMEGVPAKGMLAWKKQLPLGDILAVSAYVGTMRGTAPPNAKTPQGDLFEYDLDAILAAEAAEAAEAGEGREGENKTEPGAAESDSDVTAATPTES